tara:strand:- start:119 stop:349 length:231 start_codon:yes stop_codon:yes gene_type:complete
MDERQLILLGFGTFTFLTASAYYILSNNTSIETTEEGNVENSTNHNVNSHVDYIKKYLSNINIFSVNEKKSKPHHL